jgi:2-dehydro-3-deoxyphosphogluconate aldolase / (4S)-4-hydroxy-2-oxoglutarate aldolase
MTLSVTTVLHLSKVIPVVVIDDARDAVPLVDALVAGGVPVIEVTLRTPAGLEAIRRIASERPDVCVGAGTIVSPADVERSLDAGAQFLVSPGLPPSLVAPFEASPVPVLPGVSTVSEAMRARELGFASLKLFPASAVGGPAFLRGIGGPLPDITFCPTGGITAQTAADYLSLPNVACVGGSWLTPADAVRAGDWARITEFARATTTI